MTTYYPAVDGARAVAVLAVILFHIGGFIPSGFIGVDVFFVISGFVVAMAASDLPSSKFQLFVKSFYARRMIRILPALLVCITITMLADTLFVPQAWLSDSNWKTAVAALLGSSNYALAFFANDYWSPRSEFNPFTHTWSLGVEEQFYIIFPFIYFAWITGRQRRAIGLLIGFLILSLSLLSIWGDGAKSTWAFYSLLTRFWELAVGVLLFMWRKHWISPVQQMNRHASIFVNIIVVFGIFASFVFVDPNHFPWPGAIAPVICTVVIIMLAVARPDDVVVRLLSTRPMVLIGRISYSLYLWHWPVAVLMRWTVGLDSSAQYMIALSVSLVLAAGSYIFIENGIRRSIKIISAPRTKIILYGLFAIGLSIALVGGAHVGRDRISLSVTSDRSVWSPDSPARSIKLNKENDAGCSVVQRKIDSDIGRIQIFEPTACKIQNVSKRLFVAGDSHAWAYSGLLQAHVANSGDSVYLYTNPGCGILGLRQPDQDGSRRCAKFTRDVFGNINRSASTGDVVFLPSLRVNRLGDQWGAVGGVTRKEGKAAKIVKEAVDYLEPLSKRGIEIVFEAPKPVFRVPLFRCSDWFNSGNTACRAERAISVVEVRKRRATVMDAMHEIKEKVLTVNIWDPLPLLCRGDTCDPSRDGLPLFFDGDHLTAVGNAVLASDFSQYVRKLQIAR